MTNAHSPVRLWLEETLPNLGQALKRLRADMPSDLEARTVRPVGDVPYGTIGMAIDYRVRYHLAITPSQGFIAFTGASTVLGASAPFATPFDPWAAEFAPAAFFQALDDLVAETEPVGRTLDAAAEERLDRACAVLALYEEIGRGLPVGPGSLLASFPIRASVDEVLAMIPRSWVDDIVAVCTRLFNEVPLSGAAILNPRFALSRAVGGADADLVLDGCLLEIKSSIRSEIEPKWLRQLFGYVFLDSDDACHIGALGLLLARQAVMGQWPIDQLLDEAAGPARPSLAAMRADFARLALTLAVGTTPPI